MKLHLLFENAMSEIDYLEDYYNIQIKSISQLVKRESEKYKYGLAIYKYLCGKAHNEENPKCLEDFEKEFIKNELIEIKGENDQDDISYDIKNIEQYDGKYELDPIISEKKVSCSRERPVILNESVLVMLLIRFENVISSVYKFLLENYPEAYLKDKTVSYDKIISLNSDLEKIMGLLLNREVEEFMRRPLKEWYSTFETKHGMKFNFNGDYEEFKEIYYRRNIIVHNQGKVNEVYLEGIGGKTDLKIGDKIKVDHEYLVRAFDIVRIVLFKTFSGFVKVCNDKKSLSRVMTSLGFEYMLNSKWSVSKEAFYELMSFPELEEADVFCNKMNYFISIKNKNGIDEIKEEVEKIDTSAMRYRMSVAKPALLDDFENVSKILEKAIEIEISVNELKTWPLFIQYRKSDEYKSFVKAHESLFSVNKYSQEDINCLSETQDQL